jgi:uridine kinase
MQTIRLRVNDRVYKSLIKLLSKFGKDEIQVIEEDDNYLSIQQYLKKELSTVEDGSAEYIDIEELENTLDATIRKHED